VLGFGSAGMFVDELRELLFVTAVPMRASEVSLGWDAGGLTFSAGAIDLLLEANTSFANESLVEGAESRENDSAACQMSALEPGAVDRACCRE